MWYHDQGWAGGWFAMAVGMAGVWVLVALVAIAVLRDGWPDGWRPPEHQEPTSRQLLERRLARGEIDLEEYRRRIKAIDRSSP